MKLLSVTIQTLSYEDEQYFPAEKFLMMYKVILCCSRLTRTESEVFS